MDEQFSTGGSTDAAPVVDTSVTSTPTIEAAPAAPTIDPPATEAKDDLRSIIEAEVKGARERDEKGRFLSKEERAAEAKVGESKAANQTPDAGKMTEAPKSSPEYPISWNNEQRSKIFDPLPAEAKAVILQREKELLADYTRKTGQAAQIMRRMAPIDAVIARHESTWAERGLAPEHVITSLVNAQNKLDADPISGIATIMQSYGVTPDAVIDYFQGGGPQQNSELTQLKQQIADLQSQLGQHSQTQQQAARSQQIAQIAQFAQERDAQGQPLRPHFDQLSPIVERLLGPLMQQNPGVPLPTILQQAYDQALWSNPQTRNELLQKERETQQARLLEEQKQKAEKAKKAGSSINGTPGGGGNSNGAPAGNDIRSTILWAMNQQQ